ncbi:MAG: hypothetical protein M3Y86_04645 [Verrucomicrobiota bacterium]|nr:hypothetical protein [Verrucomicrobiota bacterium]
MKFALTVGLVSAFALSACEIDEPPPRHVQRPVAKYPNQQQAQYPAQPQPFPQEAGQPTTPPPGPVEQPTQEAPSSAPPAAQPQSAAKGDYPYGVPVPGKPGFVRSPYSPDKMTDVRGYAPGTEVKDPYTNKIFLVP